MQPSGNGVGQFSVSASGMVLQAMKEMYEEAVIEGRGEAVVKALKAIYYRLRSDPRGFGEPEFHLPAMKLEVRQAGVAPVIVSFGIHDDKPLVFIRSFHALSGKKP